MTDGPAAVAAYLDAHADQHTPMTTLFFTEDGGLLHRQQWSSLQPRYAFHHDALRSTLRTDRLCVVQGAGGEVVAAWVWPAWKDTP